MEKHMFTLNLHMNINSIIIPIAQKLEQPKCAWTDNGQIEGDVFRPGAVLISVIPATQKEMGRIVV
jgi:hypothetical protein